MLKVVGASWNQIRLSTFILGTVIVLGIVAIIVSETGRVEDDGNYSATAYYTAELGYTISFWGQNNVFEEVPKGVARAHYDPHINENGWAVFQVETEGSFDDRVQAYAAGLLEGALTWQMIYWHWQNTVNSYCANNRELCDQIRTFLQKNLDWVKETSFERQDETYWRQIFLFYTQLEGIEYGFKQGVSRSRQDVDDIESIDFLWMNIFSDLNDLEQKFENVDHRKHRNWFKHMFLKRDQKIPPPAEPRDFNCGYKRLPLQSLLVKFLPQQECLLIGHNSAGPYSHMLKVFKKYEFQYHITVNKEVVPGTRLSFSSYPAAIHSMDDFYIISNESGHNLVVAATPIIAYNTALWHQVNPIDQILTGPRAVAASRLATNGATWSSIFSKYNSGTGNKEWVILDMGLFKVISADRSNLQRYHSNQVRNLMWVLEQMPGTVTATDQTQVLLNSTYWAGYGIPYYETIYDLSGTRNMLQQHGNTFSYNETALANIFRRDQANVTDLDSLTKVMRSNLYKLDPLSEGNPRCAIGSRGDVKGISLDPTEPEGVTDIKVLRNEIAIVPAVIHNSTMRVHVTRPRLFITAGPVFSENSTPEDIDDLSPFRWSDGDFPDASHVGHPDVWTFQPKPISFI